MRSIFSAFALLLGLCSLAEAGIVTLTCKRVEDWCELRTWRVFNTRRRRFPCAQLTRARVEERFSNDGTPLLMGVSLSMPSFQILLHIDRESIPLAPFYTYNRRETIEAASRINSFIYDSQKQFLEVKRDNRLRAYWVGGICILLAILIWFVVPL